MPFPSIEQAEQQKKLSIKQNRALLKQIRHRNGKKALKDMQIVRFGNDLAIAIHRPNDTDEMLNGTVGTVYPAYLIRRDGSIDPDEVMIKIIKNSATTLNESITALKEIGYFHKNQAYDRTKTETQNSNQVYSSRMTIIPRQEKKNGKTVTVYETVILMSKVPGVRLDTLIKKGALATTKLTPEQRIRLAINIIDFYIELHQKGIYHGDIKAENFLIDLETLQVTGIDIDPSQNTELTRALEQAKEGRPEINEQSEIYPIGQDLLSSIFSGVRLEKDKQRNMLNADEVNENITANFGGYFSISDDIINLLAKMHSDDPNERGTLEIVKSVLVDQLKKIIGKDNIEPDAIMHCQIEEHQRQLRRLDTILEDPEYKIDPQFSISVELKEISQRTDKASSNTISGDAISIDLDEGKKAPRKSRKYGFFSIPTIPHHIHLPHRKKPAPLVSEISVKPIRSR